MSFASSFDSLAERVSQLESQSSNELKVLQEENERLKVAYEDLLMKHYAVLASIESDQTSSLANPLHGSTSSSSSTESPLPALPSELSSQFPKETPLLSESISTETIKKFVDTIVDDPQNNIYGLPDAIERRMYANVFKIALLSLQKVLSTAKIELIGHTIKMNMTPS